jgi:hypothetical protein
MRSIEQAPKKQHGAILVSLLVLLGGAGIMLFVVVGMQMAVIGVCGA